MRRAAPRCLLLLIALLVGCGKPIDSTSTSERTVTFHADVAPVLFTRCAGCHHVGGPAPFRLLTFDDARNRATQIAEVTASRYMPPWLPAGGHERFAGNRRLSEREIQLLADWAAAGAPEGDPGKSPPIPKFESGWQLGTPDLVLESPRYELPADGPNRFRNFVLAVPEGVDRWVRAVEIRPENSQTTHHVRLGIDVNDESVRRDEADADPGYAGMAWGQDPPGQLITWTPGMTPDPGTPGAAWRLAAGDKLVLHTHLRPSGKPETAGFRLAFHFADTAPTVRPLILRVGSRDIDIRPGEPRHDVSDSYELPIDVDVHYVFPHAHSLCREIVMEAHSPGTSAKTLLAIREFDENWHDSYRFVRPLRLPRGTRLVTRFAYDNSSSNVRNPNNPPRRVVYGSDSTDEMGDLYLQVTPVDPDQHAAFAEHSSQYELRSKIVGYRKTLELHTDDAWSIEGLASCYVANRQWDEAVQLLESRSELLETSIVANVILGTAKLAQRDADAAKQAMRRALELDDQHAPAWLGLGQAQIASSEADAAEQSLRKAIDHAPRLIVARMDLADLLVAASRLNDAAAVCREAIELAPTDHRPHLKLANLLAAKKNYADALEHFAAARALAPFVYRPEASLGIACYQYGDEQQAAELLRNALAADATDPVPHCFLGQIARRDAEWQKARKHLQRASELPTPPSWPASHRRQFLTLVYTEELQLADELQDDELAEQALSRWVELDPTNEQIRKLLEQVRADNRKE